MECLHPTNDEHCHSDNEWSSMIKNTPRTPFTEGHDHEAIKTTSERVTSLKGKITEHYHDLYVFDPHVNCVVALQRWFSDHNRELEDYEESLHMTLIRYFACILIQHALLITVFWGHVWKDPGTENASRRFFVASLCACLAFVAQAATEWKELFHLWDMVRAGTINGFWYDLLVFDPTNRPAGASCRWVFVLAILPKVSFAFLFTFLAPFEFLDSDQTSEIVLNCTGLMFLLTVDNDIFKATGGKLESEEFDDLAGRVQRSYFPIRDEHTNSRKETDEFDKKFEDRRRWQRLYGFAISLFLSSAGYAIFKLAISNSAAETTPSPSFFT